MCGSESPEGGGGLEGSVGGVRSERDGQHQRRVTHAVVCVWCISRVLNLCSHPVVFAQGWSSVGL